MSYSLFVRGVCAYCVGSGRGRTPKANRKSWRGASGIQVLVEQGVLISGLRGVGMDQGHEQPPFVLRCIPALGPEQPWGR